LLNDIESSISLHQRSLMSIEIKARWCAFDIHRNGFEWDLSIFSRNCSLRLRQLILRQASRGRNFVSGAVTTTREQTYSTRNPANIKILGTQMCAASTAHWYLVSDSIQSGGIRNLRKIKSWNRH
jgi:hypothetical protein